MTTASKFWGLVVEPGKKYAQIVPEAFKLSMASLGSEADLAQATSSSAKHSGRTSVIFETAEGNTFCLCSLTPGKTDQQPLDLVYEANEQVAFLVDGPHAVHLTGFVLDEPESEFDEEDMSEEDMSEEDMAECDDSECDSQHDDEEFDSEDFDSEELESDEFDSEDSEGEPRITVVDSEDEEKSAAKRVAAEAQAQNAAKKIKAEAVSIPKTEVKKAEEKKPSTPQQQQKKNEATSPAAQKSATPQQKPATPQQQKPAQEALMNKVLSNGLRIQDLKLGNGATANNGKTVWVHYKGLLSNGKQFDSSIGGQPLRFKLGAGQVVKGFDMGVEGMKIGSSRRIVIPPQLGYGKQRSGPIPPNSTLIFELELVKMQ